MFVNGFKVDMQPASPVLISASGPGIFLDIPIVGILIGALATTRLTIQLVGNLRKILRLGITDTSLE